MKGVEIVQIPNMLTQFDKFATLGENGKNLNITACNTVRLRKYPIAS